MTVAELKEALEDFGDHLEVMFEWLDEPREYYFEIEQMDSSTRFFEKLVIGLEKVKRPD